MSQFDNTPFYLRLFQFARNSETSRETREDFLTEIIAELLRQFVRSDHAALKSLLQEVLLSAATNAEEVSRFVTHWLSEDRVGKVEVLTQKVINNECRPDIVMSCEGNDFCIIENKLAAPFTNNQLADYDKFLIEQQPNTEQQDTLPAPNPALILITQYTGPPEGFLESSGDYGTGVRSVAYWWQIADWIDQRLAQQDSVGSEWRHIAYQLRELMVEWRMTVKDLSLDDLAALRLFLASGTKYRVESAFSEIRRHFNLGHQNPYRFKNNYPKWEKDYPVYLDWIEGNQGDFSFGWGVVFESEQQPYFADPIEPAVPKQDVACCYLSVKSDFSNDDIGKHKGWHVPQSLDEKWIYRCRDMRELVSSPNGFTASMADWVDESLKQAKEIHKRL